MQDAYAYSSEGRHTLVVDQKREGRLTRCHWAIYRTASPHISRLLVVSKRNERTVPKVVIRCPLSKFELSDQFRFEPQCRMTDYAVCGFRKSDLESNLLAIT